MEVRQVYVKTRSQFGKQCIFDDSEPTVEENIFPNSEMMEDYIHMNPVHRDAQTSKQCAVHEVQTVSTLTKESGMNHTEGGWPKEINGKDEEAVARYQRRVEKDDNWAPRMRELMEPMERYVLQNNALNIYEHYFDDMEPTELVRPLGIRTVNIYKDPQSIVRPIIHLSWSPDHGKRLAASYCSVEIQRHSQDLSLDSDIWDIENPNKALMSLKAAYPSVTIEFNPRDPSMLISGLMSGQVCNWDIRSGNMPILVSNPQFSHKNPANCALWINSKTNSEFFSASTEGTINWWDIRMLQKPLESLIMDLEDPSRGDVVRATGVASLHYEPTMGTKFMAGLENGVLVNGTRKGKNTAEKIAMRFDCHYGPVVAIDRNPFSIKNFLTVGDWTTKIWAEDTREDNLISTRQHKSILTGGCWSTSRYSVFYVINNEGMMEVFDILVGLAAPVMTTRLCEDSLKAVAPHEEGKLVAVGSDRGKIYLLESTEALTTNLPNDKILMSTYFERCSRYEKALDNRLKETKLAQRVIYQDSESTMPSREVKTRGKGSPQKSADKDKKVVEEKKKMEKERKKLRSKKTKDIWELLGDSELADVERQYFETIGKEMEKYKDAALVVVNNLSEDTTSTLSVRDGTTSKRGKQHDDVRVDKEALGRKGDARKHRTPRGQSAKDKGGKATTKTTKEIVIVRRKRDTTPERSYDDSSRRITEAKSDTEVGETGRPEIIGDKVAESEKLPEGTTVDDDYDDDDEMEETIEKKKNMTMRKKSRGTREMFLIDRNEKGSPVGSDEETEVDSSSMPCQVEERKMNALIEEMLAGLPKNILPSQLENLPHYTKDEKRLILKKNYAPPSILKKALTQAKKEIHNDRKEVITKSRKIAGSKRLEVVSKVVDEDTTTTTNKSELTIETLSVVQSQEIQSPMETPGPSKVYAVSRKSNNNNKKTELDIDTCEPIVARFGSKEILQVIGVDVTLPKPLKARAESSEIDRTEKGKKYTRISAVNVGKSK